MYIQIMFECFITVGSILNSGVIYKGQRNCAAFYLTSLEMCRCGQNNYSNYVTLINEQY